MFIAKNLRKLRLNKGLTQEELAIRIGVTGQAVGKWERDECYPDITLLPGLANLFGVTVDSLIGMDEFNIQQKMDNLQNKVHELGNQGRYSELVELLEEQIKIFPNELLTDLGIALTLAGDKSERPLRLFEEALDESSSRSYKYRGTTYAELCFLYMRYGLTEKAEKLACSLPHARESRELLLPHFLDQTKREDYLRENLPGILNTICSLIDGDIMTNNEQLHSIHYGRYINPLTPADAIQKIAEFLIS